MFARSGIIPRPLYAFSERTTRQGLPAAKTSARIFLVTTLPAPITVRAPIVTPGQTIAPCGAH